MSKPGDRWIDEIFREALDLAGNERKRFVSARCRGNPELERKVTSLLEATKASDAMLARRIDAARVKLLRSVLGDHEDAGEDLSGQRINAWLLTKRLARGGLATVYLAKRNDGAYEQMAAFKVLRRGLDTDDLVARFQVERQILSLLDHPSIARILDGGALEDGRPYLVLEYVDGLPVTTHCETRDVGIDGRIRLLMDVLQALHEAHKHLIVHRDIKPSNILVSSDGHVSLLDFGIAKLLDPEAMPWASTLTRTGVSLLTPGYGSPEQLAGRPVTTASDIYQVGEVMYELLAGRRAFVGSVRPGIDEAVPPSRVLKGTSDYNLVRGDLDAITAKAMHAVPARRYASAADMREDLQRYLDHRPINARPDTWHYRVGKLVRRRPWLIPAMAIGVLAITGYIATLTIYTRELQVEQRRASAAQAFLVNLLRSPDPYAPADPDRGREITVVEALDLGVKRLDAADDGDPELRVSLLSSIASVYQSLDENRKAIDLREQALALERQLYGNESEQVLASLSMLANEYKTSGNFVEARPRYDEQLSVARTLYSDGEPELGVAEALSADFETSDGNLDVAEDLLRSAIPRLRTDAQAHARSLVGALVALAEVMDDEPLDQVLPLLLEARQLAESTFGERSLMAALVHAQTASSLSAFGDYEAAEEKFRQALSIYDSLVGPDHGTALVTRIHQGILFHRMGRYDLAEAMHRDILGRFLAKYGEQHRGVAMSYQNLALAISSQERYAESIPLHRHAFDSFRAVLGDGNRILTQPLLSIAYASLQIGEFEAAEAAAREARARVERYAADSWMYGAASCLISLAQEKRGFAEQDSRRSGRIETATGSDIAPEPYRSICRPVTLRQLPVNH